MIVNERPNVAHALDLSTGAFQALPLSDDNHMDDLWTPSFGGDLWLRWNVADWLTTTPVWIFNRSTLKARLVRLGSRIDRPQLSPDGQYILAFRRNQDGDKILTVFSADTGAIKKSSSLLDGASIIGAAPAAWLPNGQYVYLVANKLYVSRPDVNTDVYIASLALPYNSEFDGEYVVGQSELVASSDGKQLAISWAEKRRLSWDTNIWVVNVDGSGLRQVTVAPNIDTGYGFSFAGPSWSPDGKWLSFVLQMGGESTAPVYLDDPFLGGRVIGTTGCDRSPVFVLPSTAHKQALSWPRVDSQYGLRVAAPSGIGGAWLTTCGTVFWTK